MVILFIISNFLIKICKCKGEWSMTNFIEESIRQIRVTVGEKRVILGLSGGVDSSVAAALIHRAIGKQLTCVFVDNGLLRLNEREQVEKLYGDHFDLDVLVAKKSKLFLDRLKGVADPEKKRNIIGNSFVEVFNQEVKKLKKKGEIIYSWSDKEEIIFGITE